MDDFGRTIRLPTTPHITMAARLPRVPGASGKVLRTHFHLGMSRQGQQAGHDGRWPADLHYTPRCFLVTLAWSLDLVRVDLWWTNFCPLCVCLSYFFKKTYSVMCYMELFPKYCLYNKHLTFVPSKDTCSWFFYCWKNLVQKLRKQVERKYI